MRSFFIIFIGVCFVSCTSNTNTTILIKNDDVVKVVFNNFSDVDITINTSEFCRDVNIDKFNTGCNYTTKTTVIGKDTRVFLIEVFNQTINSYYKDIYVEGDLGEPNLKIENNAQLEYIGNIKTQKNISSLLFLLMDSDVNNTHYLILYNLENQKLRSIVVLAEQMNFSSENGNESYYHSNYFVQLSNFSKTEKDSSTSVFPKSFMKKVGIKDTKCTFQYFSMFTVDTNGYIQFINICE